MAVGDVTGVYTSQMRAMDMLTAGFPCQPFSDRGQRPGVFDARGQLYRELVRILRAKQPSCFLFENVSGLVTVGGGARSSRKVRRASQAVVEPDHFEMGSVFATLLREFEGCGYDVTWRVLSSRHWLPQHRERVYMVGFRSDLHLSMEWDSVRAGDAASTLRAILEPCDSPAVAACELTPKQWEALQAQNADYPRWRYNPGPNGTTCTMAERSLLLDDKCPTLTSSYHHVSNHCTKYVVEEADGTIRDGDASLGRPRPRFLTPRECARLMGFPDAFAVPPPHDTHATAQFYRQIGNAVCVPVLRELAMVMCRQLGTWGK